MRLPAPGVAGQFPLFARDWASKSRQIRAIALVWRGKAPGGFQRRARFEPSDRSRRPMSRKAHSVRVP